MSDRFAPNAVPDYLANIEAGGVLRSSQVLKMFMDAMLSTHFPPVEVVVEHMTSSSGIRDDGRRADMEIGINGKTYIVIVTEERPK